MKRDTEYRVQKRLRNKYTGLPLINPSAAARSAFDTTIPMETETG